MARWAGTAGIFLTSAAVAVSGADRVANKYWTAELAEDGDKPEK